MMMTKLRQALKFLSCYCLGEISSNSKGVEMELAKQVIWKELLEGVGLESLSLLIKASKNRRGTKESGRACQGGGSLVCKSMQALPLYRSNLESQQN